ncbi:putative transcription regulator containing HTH domain protein [Aminobacter sp. MSH1]|uniref:helix-turn-helix domain-containing protein n=1 Tax=Aminobacter sp. MSH1 TaxID=374606 RepID=UPI000D504917|nr:XRE family transcriptional regulator [Aminobacter sp. MSH1]AWC21642.1 putative transcription regulator containing HTH domain protein [Aminobacter sp. MSH1]
MENIRPIRSDEDLQWAVAEIAQYFEHEPEPGSADAERFDVLSTLIEAYEDKHYPIEMPDPVSAIVSHMEMRGFKQRDLATVLGSASRASEIVNRKRMLNVDMIQRLHAQWKIPAEMLIQPYHLAATDTVPPVSKSSKRSAGSATHK